MTADCLGTDGSPVFLFSMDKRQIRAEMKERRRRVSAQERERYSRLVCELLAPYKDRRVCCYEALPDEIDLAPFTQVCRDVRFPQKRGREYGVEKPEEVEVWVCPGLAFTLDGKRLGFGGGWYDRFLASADPKALKLGVAYPWQIVDDLPQEPTDVKLDRIVYVR